MRRHRVVGRLRSLETLATLELHDWVSDENTAISYLVSGLLNCGTGKSRPRSS
jgi:hypothetical protein